MDITNGLVLEKLRLEGELETVAWLESQPCRNGVTSPTGRAFQFRLKQWQNRLKSLKNIVVNKMLLNKYLDDALKMPEAVKYKNKDNVHKINDPIS